MSPMVRLNRLKEDLINRTTLEMPSTAWGTSGSSERTGGASGSSGTSSVAAGSSGSSGTSGTN